MVEKENKERVLIFNNATPYVFKKNAILLLKAPELANGEMTMRPRANSCFAFGISRTDIDTNVARKEVALLVAG